MAIIESWPVIARAFLDPAMSSARVWFAPSTTRYTAQDMPLFQALSPGFHPCLQPAPPRLDREPSALPLDLIE